MTSFFMPLMDDDNDDGYDDEEKFYRAWAKTGLPGTEMSRMFSKMPKNLQHKLSKENHKLTEEPTIELSIFEKAENAIDDLDSVHWSDRLYTIRNLAYQSNHLSISDSTHALLQKYDIHTIQYIIPIVSETSRNDLEPVSTASIFGVSSQYIAEVIVIFGAKANQRIRWLMLNFGEDRHAAEQFGIQVSRLS